jgi:hypothetical protein
MSEVEQLREALEAIAFGEASIKELRRIAREALRVVSYASHAPECSYRSGGWTALGQCNCHLSSGR